MKKLLFITTQLPYPPISGGVIKSYKLIEFLSKYFEITLACPLKNEDAKYVDGFRGKVKTSEIISEPIDIKRTPLNIIKSYLFAPTLNIYRNTSKRLKSKISDQIDTYDMIFADHYEMYSYIPDDYSGLKILHTHNAEYLLWERMSVIERNLVKKFLLKLEAWRVKTTEKKFCADANLIFAAPNDQLKLNISKLSKTKETFHLGDDSALGKNIVPNFKSKHIMYVGTLNWEANVDGLLVFIKEVWPGIIGKNPDTKLFLIGKNPDERLLASAKGYQNIIFTGFVEDFSVYISQCRMAIAPLRFGSGTKVKILTYLYHGIPVVTTPIGIEGLELENERHICVAHNSNEFINHCLKLLNDELLCEKMSEEAKNIGNTKYSWYPMLNKHLSDINHAMNGER